MTDRNREWVPLSVRRGLRELGDLHPGVPEHLYRPIAYWLEGTFGYRNPGGMNDPLMHVVATKAGIRLVSRSSTDMMRELISAGEGDNDIYLDIIDATLSTGQGNARIVRQILADGRSLWTVDDSGLALTERVDPAAAEAFIRATDPKDVASEELAEAWTKVYGRTNDASDTWDHAIKAAEAVLIPIIVPAQEKPTLGHVIGMLDSQGDKFSLKLGDNGVQTLVSMLRILWPNPDRHGSPDHRRKPDESEARGVVHLAITVVQWARDGLIA